MKHILILLLFAGLGVKGQYEWSTMMATYPKDDPVYAAKLQSILNIKADTCQRFRDSVTKYQKNIEIWKRQYHAGMTQLEKTALDALVNQLQARREEYLLKLKNCK